MKNSTSVFSSFRRLGFCVFIFLFFSIFNNASAATPNLSLVLENGNNVRFTVSGADSIAGISLYEKSGNSGLWTVITNFGLTDQNGYYSTLFGLGQNPPYSIDYYVVINSKISETKTIYPSQACQGDCSNTSVSFSQNNPTLNVGQSTQVSVYGGSGSYYISSNSNPSVLSATLSGNQINLYGLASGYSQLTLCSYSSVCGNLQVNVNQQGSSSQNLTFSEYNPSIIVGQSRQVFIYSSIASPSYYVSANTNPSVVSPSISGSVLNLQGLSNGSSTLTICHSGYVCGYISVTVSMYYDYASSYPLITSSALPLAYANQYYSYQLPVIGGSAPYIFLVSSGSLPAGLTLSSSGLIYGTPVCGSFPTVTFQVRDSANRVSSKDYSFQISNCSQYYPNYPSPNYYPTTPASGIFKNGHLVNDSGTVYIVYKNTKIGFLNASSFEGLGYQWKNIQTTSSASLTPSSYIVITPSGQHPWGSWVLSGGTVYFIHELGLIPISDYDIFLNNGGDPAKLVPANTYDLSLSRLSLMTRTDPRLR